MFEILTKCPSRVEIYPKKISEHEVLGKKDGKKVAQHGTLPNFRFGYFTLFLFNQLI